MVDEIAALVSLCLGIRLKAGPCTRLFQPGGDPKGHPYAWDTHETPVLLSRSPRPILPRALGEHSIQDAAPLASLTKLSPSAAVALIRAARLYQDGMWIAESEPSLSWLMFVSAIEVAAVHWNGTQEPALTRLRKAQPDLVQLLESNCSERVLRQVANMLADTLKSTTKFINFVKYYCPNPSNDRPPAHLQHKWSKSAIGESMSRIYDYRSRALHNGTPFPAPMCEPPAGVAPGPYAEIPNVPIAISTMGGLWLTKDIPMLLHTFEYVVRRALLKWWSSMVQENISDAANTYPRE